MRLRLCETAKIIQAQQNSEFDDEQTFWNTSNRKLFYGRRVKVYGRVRREEIEVGNFGYRLDC